MLELMRHVVTINIHCAYALLASISANLKREKLQTVSDVAHLSYTSRADQVVWMSSWLLRIVGHTAHHHHCWPLVPNNLYLWECFPL